MPTFVKRSSTGSAQKPGRGAPLSLPKLHREQGPPERVAAHAFDEPGLYDLCDALNREFATSWVDAPPLGIDAASLAT